MSDSIFLPGRPRRQVSVLCLITGHTFEPVINCCTRCNMTMAEFFTVFTETEVKWSAVTDVTPRTHEDDKQQWPEAQW